LRAPTQRHEKRAGGDADGERGQAMAQAYELLEHNYDVVIVGAGGAGLRAA